MKERADAPAGRQGWIKRAALAVSVVLACAASAQNAPAGNAHPQNQWLSAGDGARVDPFGGAGEVAGASIPSAEKLAFARSVNLEPLRDLAVLHNGRVKILGTLARETVSDLCGRTNYLEADSTGSRKFDPLFTLLDLMIDPAYYFDKPLLYINYLPLRREFLEMAFPTDGTDVASNARNEHERERWMKLQRITPVMTQRYSRAILERHGADPAFLPALNSLEDALVLWQRCRGNLLMVAPESHDAPWAHVSSLPEGHPVRVAFADLGSAWRARDAVKVSDAAGRIAAELPKINPGVYPTWKRQAEATYNRVNAFEWGYWAYFCALVSLVLAFGTGRGWIRATGTVFLLCGLGLHAFGFISRCFIAERFAIQNQFESMTGLSLFAATAGVAIMLARRQPVFGAAAAGVGFLVLITATQTGIPGVDIGREAAILNTSVLLKYHVTTVLLSYGLIALGFVVSLFYLAAHYFGRGSVSAGLELAHAALGEPTSAEAVVAAPRARLMADLDTAQMTVLQLAFWGLGVGILLGAWWADHSWGRWWAFDPKETWALVTWIVYLIVVHVRMATGQNKGLVTAWLSVVGFAVMLWTYFGVNLLLPGLHAYA